jgi:hypothetical protein
MAFIPGNAVTWDRTGAEDSPTSLINHINWLKDIGYKNMDIVRKYYNYCVYGGYRHWNK